MARGKRGKKRRQGYQGDHMKDKVMAAADKAVEALFVKDADDEDADTDDTKKKKKRKAAFLKMIKKKGK